MSDAGDVSWVRLLVAFTTVLGLLAGLGFVLKYISARGLVFPSAAVKARRMQIVESLALDTRRRLVIVRCDAREHLLLLNGERDIVVESNLPSSPPPAAP